MENDGKNDGKNDANLTVGRIVFWVAIAILVAAAAAIFAFVPVRYLPWPSADISRTGSSKHSSKINTEQVVTILTPRWSTDGDQVVFELGNTQNAYIINRNGSKMRVFTSVNPPDTKYNSYAADLSPDGRQLVYTTSRHSREELGEAAYKWDFEIEVTNIDGTGRKKLTRDTHWRDTLNDARPTWSPAGDQVAFVTKIVAKGDLLSVVASTGEPEPRILARMPAGIKISSKPLWSPDGKSIAFMRKTNDKIPESPWKRTDNFHLYTIKVDGTGMKRVFSTKDPTPEGYEYTEWRRLFGTAERSQKNGKVSFALEGTAKGLEQSHHVLLHIIEPDTGEIEIIPLETHRFQEGPTWGPEGRTLLVGGKRTQIRVEGTRRYILSQHEARLAIINLETGEEKDLADGLYAAWSPDKSRIAIVNPRSNNYLVTVKPDGSDSRTLAFYEWPEGIRPANPGRGEN